MIIHFNEIGREADSLRRIEKKLTVIAKAVFDCNQRILSYDQAHSAELAAGIGKIQKLSCDCGKDIDALLSALELVSAQYKDKEREIIMNAGNTINPGATVRTIDLTDISNILKRM